MFKEIVTFLMLRRELKVGRPSDKDTKIGALISKEHLGKVRIGTEQH